MFCKNCGATMDDDAKFCVECGQKVVSKSAPKKNKKPEAQPSQPSPSAKKGSGKNVALWILGIIVFISTALVLLIIFWPAPTSDITQPAATATPAPVETQAVADEPAAVEVSPVDALVAGLDRDIISHIGNIRWESTGNSVAALPNDALPDGYPREFTIAPSGTVIEFDTISNKLSYTQFENGVQTAQSWVPFTVLNNTYISAFKRTQDVNGVANCTVESVFFISEGQLYECEVINGIDASNYMAYANTGAASTPLSAQAQIDAMVAGLNRDFLSAVENMVWLSSGEWIPALPNDKLPAGYPRLFETVHGGTQYVFNVTKKEVTLTNYDVNGTITATATVPFTVINKTYVSAFEGTQVIDGKSRSVKSVFFVSDGQLYECQVVDGIDASNYMAYYPVG